MPKQLVVATYVGREHSTLFDLSFYCCFLKKSCFEETDKRENTSPPEIFQMSQDMINYAMSNKFMLQSPYVNVLYSQNTCYMFELANDFTANAKEITTLIMVS